MSAKFAMIEVIEDAHTKHLCFASKEDAERFQEFCTIYQEESGAGNGYGAYWIFSRNIIQCDEIPSFCVAKLNEDLLQSMAKDVLDARKASRKHKAKINIRVGLRNNAATFVVGSLPERKRPKVGDMFRTLYSVANDHERLVGEGRVLKDFGAALEVISCRDEDLGGKPKRHAKKVIVRASSVMKIYDWLAEHNSR